MEDFVRTVRTLTWTLLLVIASARSARADGFVSPFLGFNFGGDSNCATLGNCEDKRSNFGVSVGSMGPVFGFEAEIGFAKDFFGKVPGVDNSVFSAMGNVLVGIGVGPVQPYVLAGLGLIRPHTSVTLAPLLQEFGQNSLGYDFGGGVKLYPSRHVGLRGDIRHLRTAQEMPIIGALNLLENEKLDFWRASVGLALRF